MHDPNRFGGAKPPAVSPSVARNRQERLYGRAESRGEPVFTDINPDNRKTLAGESNSDVVRSQVYRGFVIKEWRPYHHWKVFCLEDQSMPPDELRGAYTSLKLIRIAIDEFINKNGEAGNETPSD